MSMWYSALFQSVLHSHYSQTQNIFPSHSQSLTASMVWKQLYLAMLWQAAHWFCFFSINVWNSLAFGLAAVEREREIYSVLRLGKYFGWSSRWAHIHLCFVSFLSESVCNKKWCFEGRNTILFFTFSEIIWVMLDFWKVTVTLDYDSVSLCGF